MIMNANSLATPTFTHPESDPLITAVRNYLAANALAKKLTLLSDDFYRAAINIFQPSIDYSPAMRNRNRENGRCGEPITQKCHLYMADKITNDAIETYVRQALEKKGYSYALGKSPVDIAVKLEAQACNTLSDELQTLFPHAAQYRDDPEKWALFFSEAMAAIVCTAMRDGISLDNGNNIAHELTLGERIEVVMTTRESGVYGDYIEPSNEYHCIACIDFVYFGVTRFVEVDHPAYVVKNLANGNTCTIDDRHGLGLIKKL